MYPSDFITGEMRVNPIISQSYWTHVTRDYLTPNTERRLVLQGAAPARMVIHTQHGGRRPWEDALVLFKEWCWLYKR